MSGSGSMTSLPAARDALFPKSATLGPNSSLHFTRPSTTQPNMAHTLTTIRHTHSPASADMSLPLGRKLATKSQEVDEEEDDDTNHNFSPVPTDFCDWCCKYFANSLTKVGVAGIGCGWKMGVVQYTQLSACSYIFNINYTHS